MKYKPLTESASAVSEETKALFEQFCNHLKTEKTAREYAYLLTDLCKTTDFLELTTKQITDYFSRLEHEHYSKSTMVWQVRAFRSFAKFIDSELTPETAETSENKGQQKRRTKGHYESLFPEFAFERCTLPPAPVPDYASVDRVLEQLLCDHQYGAYGAVCLVFKCGFTSDEVCSITKDRLVIDDNNHVGVVFSDTTDRFVKLPPDCVSIVSVLAHASADQFLFKSWQRNVPLTVKTLQVALRDACKKAGVPAFTLQELRNLAIGTMLNGGASDSEVSEYVGTGVEWIPRYHGCIPQLEHAAVDYSRIRII